MIFVVDVGGLFWMCWVIVLSVLVLRLDGSEVVVVLRSVAKVWFILDWVVSGVVLWICCW